MHFQYLPYLWVLVVSAVVTAAVGTYAWRHRSVPGATPFAALMLAAVVWALANGLEMAGTDLPTKLFWANVQYLSYAITPVAWLALALQYTDRGAGLTRRNLAGLFIVPAITVGLAWTNEFHGLLRRNVYLDIAGPFPVVGKTAGPWYWVFIAYTYLLILIAIYFLLDARRRSPHPYRGQSLVLSIGAALPLFTSILYGLGLSPIPRVDISPAIFCVCGLVIAWGLFRYRLFNLMPVARSSVIDSMDDGVIVLDTRHRIVDMNPAARSILGRRSATRSIDPAIGDEAARAFGDWGDLLRLTYNPEVTWGESTVTTGDDPCTYELHATALSDRRGRPIGQVITLRDITQRTRTETLLLQQQEALAVMQDRERLAQELHDGLAQDLAGLRLKMSVWHKLVETDPLRLHAELDAGHELLSKNIGEVRRTIYALRPLALDKLGFFPALRQFVNDFGGQTQLHIDLSITGPQERLPALLELVVFRIIQESLNNVGKHARAQEVRIDLDLQAHDHLTLTIGDDGRGFDPDSLSEAATYGHLGLVQMRDRVRDLRGEFALVSQPGQGTEIRVVLPL